MNFLGDWKYGNFTISWKCEAENNVGNCSHCKNGFVKFYHRSNALLQ